MIKMKTYIIISVLTMLGLVGCSTTQSNPASQSQVEPAAQAPLRTAPRRVAPKPRRNPSCHRHFNKYHCHKSGHEHKGLSKWHSIQQRTNKYKKSISPRARAKARAKPVIRRYPTCRTSCRT
jgi:hypothetical protein